MIQGNLPTFAFRILLASAREGRLSFHTDHYYYFTELPIVTVTHRVSINNVSVLTCQAYGFYPKEINATWNKDGEVIDKGNSSMQIVPNSDGTFNARLSIQINSTERNLYRCHVEHVSFREPMIVLEKKGKKPQ